MDFLIRAEKYAINHGDAIWFKKIYNDYRSWNSVEIAVWKTLAHLYGNEVANRLQKPVT